MIRPKDIVLSIIVVMVMTTINIVRLLKPVVITAIGIMAVVMGIIAGGLVLAVMGIAVVLLGFIAPIP